MPESPPRSPRVRIVACVAGVSLERGVPAEEIHEYIREPDNVVWVDVQDPSPAEMAMLTDEFGFHPLALEEAGQSERRTKVEEYKGYLLLVTHAAIPAGDSRELQTTEIVLFIGRNYLVSLHAGGVPGLEGALTRWMHGGAMLREGMGFLLFAVLDAIVGSYMPLLDHVEEEINEIEIAMFTRTDDEALRSLLRLKRMLITLRRVFHPVREAFDVLLRRDHPLFLDSATVYLREVAERVLRILDILETEREMVAGALDASLAISSHRLNHTMKSLAVITVAVAVVGSVFGAYGMNVESLPFASTPGAFWIVFLGTLVPVAAAILIGWWKKWW